MVKNGVEELSSHEFQDFITKNKISLVDFFAEWCMPCVMLAPVIEELAEKLKGKVSFAKVNVDDNQEIAGKFSIMSIPTLVIFKNGKLVDRITGALPADILEERLKKQF